jgi:hypothetical protein
MIASSKDRLEDDLLKRAATWWAGPALSASERDSTGFSLQLFDITHLSECVGSSPGEVTALLRKQQTKERTTACAALPALAEPRACL